MAAFSNLLKGFNDQRLISYDQWDAFGPARGDVSQNQRMDDAAGHGATAVSYQIGFHVAWFGIIPIPKCSNWNTPSQHSGTHAFATACPGYSLARLRQ
jgi:hypothetical protein